MARTALSRRWWRENNNNIIILISRATFNDDGGGRNAPLSAVRLLTAAAAYVDVRRRSFRSGGGGGGGGTKNAATELIIAAAAPTDRPTSTAGAHFRNAPVTSFFSFSPHIHGGGTLARHGCRQLSMFIHLSAGIPARPDYVPTTSRYDSRRFRYSIVRRLADRLSIGGRAIADVAAEAEQSKPCSRGGGATHIIADSIDSARTRTHTAAAVVTTAARGTRVRGGALIW